MKRHPFNVFSLIFGIALILTAAWAAWIAFPAPRWFYHTSDWLLPAAAILVGAALLSPLFTPTKGVKTSGNGSEGDAPEETTDTPPGHP